jgi:hypothetical protein
MGKARCFAVLVLLFAEHFASDADDRLSAAGDEFLAIIDKQPNIRNLPSGVRYVVQNTKKQADTRYGRLTNSMPKLDTSLIPSARFGSKDGIPGECNIYICKAA